MGVKLSLNYKQPFVHLILCIINYIRAWSVMSICTRLHCSLLLFLSPFLLPFPLSLYVPPSPSLLSPISLYTPLPLPPLPYISPSLYSLSLSPPTLYISSPCSLSLTLSLSLFMPPFVLFLMPPTFFL